jgi:hypothetical protein
VALTGGVALHAINVHIVTTILPSVVGDIGGLDYYAWNVTLFVVTSIIGSTLTGKLLGGWARSACSGIGGIRGGRDAVRGRHQHGLDAGRAGGAGYRRRAAGFAGVCADSAGVRAAVMVAGHRTGLGHVGYRPCWGRRWVACSQPAATGDWPSSPCCPCCCCRLRWWWGNWGRAGRVRSPMQQAMPLGRILLLALSVLLVALAAQANDWLAAACVLGGAALGGGWRASTCVHA